jgi:ribosomal protein S18 acetylase RimI-like enzyme
VALDPLTVGPARFRVGPWHEDPDVAYLIPLTTAITLRPDVLSGARERLRAMGFSRLYTAAVGPAERDAMTNDEFVVHEELHLLRHNLQSALPMPPTARHRPRLRRGRRADHEALLELDRDAFGPFWRLDRNGLHEALNATPTSRLRVTDDGARSGYSITGRAGHHGYLQRLAVAPANWSRGLGTALLADSLHWLRRRGVTSVLVNTQMTNERALKLYERAGFEREPDRLSVLHRELR